MLCEIIASTSHLLVIALTPILSFSEKTRPLVIHNCYISIQELSNKKISHVEFSAFNDNKLALGPDVLHMHHIHISRMDGSRDAEWSITGDLWSINADGNYTYSIPYSKGYCMNQEFINSYYSSNVILNDMRVKKNINMNVQVIATFHFTSMPCKPISQIWIQSPIQKNAPFYTYAASNIANTVTWWSTRWPYSGRLLNITRYHTHQKRMGTTYFIYDTLASYGLDLQNWTLIDNSNQFPYIMRAQLWDIANLRYILDRHHVCKFEGAYMKNSNGIAYDAPSHIECKDGHVFHTGQVYTIIKLHMPKYETSTKLIYTHDIPWFYMDTWDKYSYSKTIGLMPIDINSKK